MPNPYFIPSGLLDDTKDLTVLNIILAGHSPNPSARGSDTFVNHWTIYLEIPQERSICLNMLPNSTTGEPGTLFIERLENIMSKDVVHHISFPAVQGLSARHVIDRITAKHYHQYRYGEQMLECRYWAYVVMKDFRDAGYIEGNDTEVYAAVSSTWKAGGVELSKTPDWTEGTFD
jgi:hypothetical protein